MIKHPREMVTFIKEAEMFGKIIADYTCSGGYLVGDGAPGPGIIYYDGVGGRPMCGDITYEDFGDVLDH